MQMVRKKTNKRLMEVKISWEQGEEKDGDKTFVKSHTDRANMWHIE